MTSIDICFRPAPEQKGGEATYANKYNSTCLLQGSIALIGFLQPHPRVKSHLQTAIILKIAFLKAIAVSFRHLQAYSTNPVTKTLRASPKRSCETLSESHFAKSKIPRRD